MVPPTTKELVRALVETQQEPAVSTDVIAGKGDGLILLLHGGPGTGKTLTAGMSPCIPWIRRILQRCWLIDSRFCVEQKGQ